MQHTLQNMCDTVTITRYIYIYIRYVSFVLFHLSLYLAQVYQRTAKSYYSHNAQQNYFEVRRKNVFFVSLALRKYFHKPVRAKNKKDTTTAV